MTALLPELTPLPEVPSLSQAQVLAQLDILTARAKSRREAADGWFSALLGGADLDFMTSEEKCLRNALLAQLPSAAEEREAAATRIQARLAERKAKASHRAAR